MKFCSVCGNQLNDDAKFCAKCGTAFESNTVNASAISASASSIAASVPSYAQAASTSSESTYSAPAAPVSNNKKDVPAIVGLALSVVGIIIILAAATTSVAGFGSMFDIGGLVCGIIGTRSRKFKGMAIPAIVLAGIAMVFIVPIKATMLTR